MSSHNSLHYIKIGAFVIAAIFLLMVGIFILGADLFKKPAYMAETYLNESVQGLRVGATLQARGVPLGRVTAIQFVTSIYGDQIDNASTEAVRASHYVRLVLAFDQLPQSTSLEQQIKSGLRLRIVPQGITGLSSLDLDFFDEKELSDLPIFWQPQHPYIPAIPSAMNRLGKSVDNAIASMQKIDLSGTVSNINATLAALQTSIQNFHTDTMVASVTNVAEKIAHLTDSANLLLTNSDLHTSLAELSLTLKTLRTQLDTELPPTLHALRALAKTEAPKTLAALQQTADTATDLLRHNAPLLTELTPQLQTLLQNANALLLKLNDQPSLLLLAAPKDDGAK